MSPHLLGKFKVVRCPIDNEIFRKRTFLSHVKAKHRGRPEDWAKRIQKEETVLVCMSPKHHHEAKIELCANTRNGNNVFIRKHAAHLDKKQAPLSIKVKEAVRRMLMGVNNVDLDASPPPPPPPTTPPLQPRIDTPTIWEAVGVLDNINQPQQGQDVLQSIITGFTPPRASSTLLNLDEIEPTLMLDAHNPVLIEPQVAQLLNTTYQGIYEPGLRYPSNDESVQVSAPTQQHASTSMTDVIPTRTADQGTHMTTPEQQHAATSMTTAEHGSDDDTESIPLLSQGLDHIREVNNMKNVMLTQIMQDNIDLLQSKIQSRKHALRAMEDLFEARAQTPLSDDMTLELSRIIHLKNKFMKQVLQETSQLQPQIFSLLTRN